MLVDIERIPIDPSIWAWLNEYPYVGRVQLVGHQSLMSTVASLPHIWFSRWSRPQFQR